MYSERTVAGYLFMFVKEIENKVAVNKTSMSLEQQPIIEQTQHQHNNNNNNYKIQNG